MAISRLVSQDKKASGTSSPTTATYAATATSGNLLIAAYFSNANNAPATPSGWSILCGGGENGSSLYQTIFYKLSNGTETGVTVTSTGAPNFCVLDIFEYTGNANPIVLDGTASTKNNSGVTVITYTTPAITTTNASDLIFVAMCIGGTITAPSWTTSTLIGFNNGVTINMFCGEFITSSTQTAFSDTASWTTAKQAGSMIGAFKAASAAPAANGNFLSFM